MAWVSAWVVPDRLVAGYLVEWIHGPHNGSVFGVLSMDLSSSTLSEYISIPTVHN